MKNKQLQDKPEPLSWALVALMIVASAVPLLVLALRGVSNEFTFENTALAQLVLDSHKLLFQPFDSTGIFQVHANNAALRFVPTLFLASVSSMTGLPLEVIQFLPISGVALLPAFYVFGKKILRSDFYAALLTVYLTYVICFTNVFFSVYPQGFGLVLFFVFVFFCLRPVEKFVLSPYVPLIILVTFTALLFTYYTTELLAIGFVGAITAITSLPYVKSATKLRYLPLVLALLVIFLAFDPVAQDFLYLLGAHGFSMFVFALQAAKQTLSSGYPLSQGVSLAISVAFYIILLSLTIAYLCCLIRDFFKKDNSESVIHTFIVALLAILLIRAVVYFLWWGILDLVYPTVFLSFASFYALLRFKRWWSSKYLKGLFRNAAVLPMVVMVVLSMTLFFIKEDSMRGYRNNTADQSLAWVVEHMNYQSATFLTELATGEQFLIALVNVRAMEAYVDIFTTQNYIFGDDGSISFPVGPDLKPILYDYLLISKWDLHNYFMIDNWLVLKPIGKQIDALNNLPYANKLYDGEIMVYNFQR